MRHSIHALLLFALSASVLGSCADLGNHGTGRRVQPTVGRPGLDDPRLEEWYRFEALKRDINLDSRARTKQEFVGKGTLHTRSQELGGFPRFEFVQVRFTYENTTKESLRLIRVWLEVLDSKGEVVSREQTILSNFLGWHFNPGDTFSGVLRTPTRGIHKQAGWTWRLSCEPLRTTVLPTVVSSRRWR